MTQSNEAGPEITAEQDRMVEERTGGTLTWWRSMPWWPNNIETRVRGGGGGHEREITVNIEGFGHGIGQEYIHQPVNDCVAALLPDWLVENRGSRLEMHPTGRFAHGFEPADVGTAVQTLRLVGLDAAAEK